MLSRLYDFVIHDFVNFPFPCPSCSSWPFVDEFRIHHASGTRNLAMILRFNLMYPSDVWHVATNRVSPFFLSEKELP